MFLSSTHPAFHHHHHHHHHPQPPQENSSCSSTLAAWFAASISEPYMFEKLLKGGDPVLQPSPHKFFLSKQRKLLKGRTITWSQSQKFAWKHDFARRTRECSNFSRATHNDIRKKRALPIAQVSKTSPVEGWASFEIVAYRKALVFRV